MEDSKIIDLFLERSERAVDELSHKYGAAVRIVAGNILKDEQDVEECVNDTLFSVWNAIPPQIPESLRAFTVTVARNTAIKRYRSNTALKRNGFYDTVLDELAECLPAPETVESEYGARALSESVNRFLAALKPEDRKMFVCRYWFGEPVSGIAERLGLRPGRVSLRLYRMRERLREYLKKEGYV